jgi:hypothetical protein
MEAKTIDLYSHWKPAPRPELVAAAAAASGSAKGSCSTGERDQGESPSALGGGTDVEDVEKGR